MMTDHELGFVLDPDPLPRCPKCGSPQTLLRTVKTADYLDAVPPAEGLPGVKRFHCTERKYSYPVYKCMVQCGAYFSPPVPFAREGSAHTTRMENLCAQWTLLHPLQEVYEALQYRLNHHGVTKILSAWREDLDARLAARLVPPDTLLLRQVRIDRKIRLLLCTVRPEGICYLDLIPEASASALLAACTPLFPPQSITRVWLEPESTVCRAVKGAFPKAEQCILTDALQERAETLKKSTADTDPDEDGSAVLLARWKLLLHDPSRITEADEFIGSLSMGSRFEFELMALLQQYRQEIVNGIRAPFPSGGWEELRLTEKEARRTPGCTFEATRLRLRYGDARDLRDTGASLESPDYRCGLLEANFPPHTADGRTFGAPLGELCRRLETLEEARRAEKA